MLIDRIELTKEACRVFLSCPFGSPNDTQKIEKYLLDLSKRRHVSSLCLETAKKILDEEYLEEFTWICEVYDITLS